MVKPQMNGAVTCRKVNRMYRRLHWRQRRRDGRDEIREQLEDFTNPHNANYVDDEWWEYDERVYERELWVRHTMGIQRVW